MKTTHVIQYGRLEQFAAEPSRRVVGFVTRRWRNGRYTACTVTGATP